MDKKTRDSIFVAVRDGEITINQAIEMFKNNQKFREANV